MKSGSSSNSKNRSISEEEEEDPFACFGSSSCSEDEDVDSCSKDDQNTKNNNNNNCKKPMAFSTTTTAKDATTSNLVNKKEDGNNSNVSDSTIVNEPQTERLLQKFVSPRSSFNNNILIYNEEESKETIEHHHHQQTPWTYCTYSSIPKPLYVAPQIAILATTSTKPKGSGGRGYFATRDIPPGTLLLVEKPIVTWSEEQIGKPLGLISVEHALQQPNAYDILRALQLLHPTKVYLEELLSTKQQIKIPHQYATKSNTHNDGGDTTTTTTTTDSMDQRILQLYESYKKKYAKSNVLRRVLLLGQAAVNKSASACHGEEKEEEEEEVGTFTVTDALRMLMALRFNAFGTGTYLHMSMFNHGCIPNCTKFSPEEYDENSSINHRKRNSNDNGRRSYYYYSQVWTTKWVKQGQELTLFYLEPRELSHATRRFRLFEQHLFDIDSDSNDIGTEPFNTHTTMEIVNGSIPVTVLPPLSIVLAKESTYGRNDSHIQKEIDAGTTSTCEEGDGTNDSTTVVSLIEDALADLEALQVQMDCEIASSSSSSSPTIETTTSVLLSLYPKCKALESSSLNLCQESISLLNNPNHILMIRCYRLHTDCAALVLNDILRPLLANNCLVESTTKRASTATEVVENSNHPDYYSAEKESINVGYRCIASLYNLLELQLQLLGRYHFDVARTYYDLWKEIGYILSTRKVTKLNQIIAEHVTTTTKPKEITTFVQWSKEEDRCRREYERISRLYPRDIDTIISQQDTNNTK